MFEAFRNAWKIQDLRKKIIYTVFIIILFRLGSTIPVPFLDPEAIKQLFNPDQTNELVRLLDYYSGGAMSRASIFAMSISPYITASIIMQLLTIAIPALERMQKEGDDGRKKIQQISRYLTVALGLIQGFGFYNILQSFDVVRNASFFTMVAITLSFTAGTAIVMWLGEKINEKGIGNGISMILFASIVSRGGDVIDWIRGALTQATVRDVITVIAVLIISIIMIAAVVMINDAERRLPVQYAKRVVGRKMYGGQSTHLPIKVSMTGVMPIIFAQSIVYMPTIIAGFIPNQNNWFVKFVKNYLGTTSAIYIILYFVLIIAFNYFYIYISYNPVEIANNLQKNGGFIPGIRPGEPTTMFIQKVLNRVTLLGALFLAVIAVLPIILSATFALNFALGGTTILIVVGVILETSKQLESQMLMRHYKGFLE